MLLSSEDFDKDDHKDYDDENGYDEPDPVHALSCRLLIRLSRLNVLLGFLRIIQRRLRVSVNLNHICALLFQLSVYLLR